MSFMSSFTSIINADPAKIVTNLVGGVATRALGSFAQGPLAALSKPKHGLNMLKYPQDLGESSGAFVNWIQFNILESVATASFDGVAGSAINQALSGVANREGGGNAKDSFGLLNKGVSKINSTVSNLFGSNDLIGNIGINAKTVFQPLQRVRQTSTVISLYMPHTIQFNQNNQYSELSLSQQLGLILQGVQAASGFNKTKSATAVAGPGAELAAQFSGVDKNLFTSLATGTVVNPQLEVIFQQTDLRKFQFDFIMAARSSSEMDAIEAIVKTFRMAAAPKIAGNDGRYLIPPDEFDISFMFNGGNVPFIPRISTCVLSNLTVDMAPSGQYSTFADGRPVQVRLTLQFTEVDLMHKDRIAQGF